MGCLVAQALAGPVVEQIERIIDFVLVHLMSELLGLNRGRVVLADFVGDIALQGLTDRKLGLPTVRCYQSRL